MHEYDLANAILIRPLIQPCTCKMGSSIFAGMSRLKFASTTRASLPSIPSTERINREKIPLLVADLTVLILLDFIPPIQDRYHWLKPVGICISVTNFDVDYDVGLSVP